MNPDYLNILLELWPGLILKLRILKKDDYHDLDLIQTFLSCCEKSPPCWKLSFSKVVIDINIKNMRKYRFIESNENVSKLKHQVDSLSKMYDVEFENISYEDLLINRRDYFKKYVGRMRNKYNKAKRWFDRLKLYLDSLFNNTNDSFNQTIEELKLKDFEFYKSKIKLKRYD